MEIPSRPFDQSIGVANLQTSPQNVDTGEENTLFPKISGKLPELIKNYVHANRGPPSTPEDKSIRIAPGTPNLLNLTGTVKLHGTHADVVIYHDDTIRLQSRNRLSLDAENDNFGVAAHLLPLRLNLLALRDRLMQRFKDLSPRTEVLEEQPVIIAGEWVGPGIQKGVALAKLKGKYFVIISVAINEKWVPDGAYSDIEDSDAGIFHISRGGFFHEVLDIKDPERARKKMMELTLAVEKECPFGKSFGISGVGEGIVWKVAPPFGESARFWVKTKGPLHRVSNTDELKRGPPSLSEREKAEFFAEAAVTEMRLQQGWDYLGEMGIRRNAKAVPTIMKWIVDDVMVEEKSSIGELGVDKKALRKAIENMVKVWFLKELREKPEV